MGSRKLIPPTKRIHDIGVADHLMVGYSFDTSTRKPVYERKMPRPIAKDKAPPSEQDMQKHFPAEDFRAFVASGEVDEAWGLLSTTAERLLCEEGSYQGVQRHE